MRRLLAAACAVAIAAVPRAAGAQASAYVPLDDAAYAYVNALVARGALRSLPSLERPYTTGQLRGALAATDSAALGPTARRWLRALDAAVRRWETPRDSAPALRLALFALGTAESSGRRELMLADTTSGAYPGVGGRLLFTAGPVVAVGRLQLDNRLKHDPDFRGSKRRSMTGRAEDAYVEGRWRWASLLFGRQARSIGPSMQDGLQLGGYAYSWDQLSGRLGTDRLSLSSVVARLDPYLARGDSGSFERHFAMHRLAGRWRDLEIAASEAVLYGGVGRGTELAYANPLSLYQLAQYNETRDGNVSYAADLSWRPGRFGAYAAQLLVDDFQIDRCDTVCAEPASWGLTLQAEGVPLYGEQRAFASYTRVSNLTYRAIQPWERWATQDVGLGRGFADYDEARAGLDLALLAAPVRLYVAHRRQGEGNYRQPFPAIVDMPSVPAIFAGVVERSSRVGMSAAAVVLGRAALSADLGYNRVRDAGHVAGRKHDGFEGRVRVTLDLGGATFRP